MTGWPKGLAPYFRFWKNDFICSCLSNYEMKLDLDEQQEDVFWKTAFFDTKISFMFSLILGLMLRIGDDTGIIYDFRFSVNEQLTHKLNLNFFKA
jgi:hypothetical protein